MCIGDQLPLCNKLPQNPLTYSNNMCYVTVLWICSAGSSNSGSHKGKIQVSRAVFILRLPRRRSQKWASCWRALVPCGLWAGGPKSSHPAGWGPLSVPCRVGLPIEQLTAQELASSEQVREQNQRTKEVSFLQLNLGRDIPSLLLYSIS